MKRNILILGASYGSLLASKIMFGGHDVTLVCLPTEVDLINSEGFRVRMPIRGRADQIEIDSRKLAGKVRASGPTEIDLDGYDLVGLAMQEPQYRSAGMPQLMSKIAASGLPCMSIMNMPPLPFLRRFSGLDCDALKPAFYSTEIWDKFAPAQMTLCSPDPQAVRPHDEKINVLQVTLPTNFKVAKFDSENSTAILRGLQDDVDAVRYGMSDGVVELPVKIRVYDSIFVPLAKWAMLLAGNYRCITADGMRTAQEAVHSNPDESRSIYQFVTEVCLKLGAKAPDMVPFDKYADAAKSLSRPSSAARALNNGAPAIERTDKLVQLVAAQFGMRHPVVDAIVQLVDSRLNVNCRAKVA